jgi:hypothetical protein
MTKKTMGEIDHQWWVEQEAKALAKELAEKEAKEKARAEEERPIFERIGELVGADIKRLERRIAELEARDWVGIWEAGKAFAKGSLITADGSTWCATRAYPEGKPGTPNSGWRLIAKRGRDGKDAK